MTTYRHAFVAALITVGVGLAFTFTNASGRAPTIAGLGADDTPMMLEPGGGTQGARQEEPSASNPLRNAYFGELHVHTSLSLDAFMNGNRHGPEVAYRFASGQPLTLYGGETTQLRVPLDFIAITDHAESFGDLSLCKNSDSVVYDIPTCQRMRTVDRAFQARIIGGWRVDRPIRAVDVCGEDGHRCVEARKDTWRRSRELADQFNDSGRFTTLVAYEYSPVNLNPLAKVHRNVIFRTADVPDTVFSAFDGTAEDLHAWLESACQQPCQVLTIPHNPNAASGRFFWPGLNSDGTPWTRAILDRRARVERLVEIYQGKGSSECHTGLGLTDEECGFEMWVRNCGPDEEEGCAGTHDMVRDVIVDGLRVEQERGVNPFKLGFIGATDAHLSNPGDVEEDDYRGQLGIPDDTPQKRLAAGGGQGQARGGDGGWGFGGPTKFSPGGLAGVWAEENTRESIWDALARRETFGTSGPRIRVRFFGGFELPEDLHDDRDVVRIGYERGVAMGGDLTAAPSGEAPRFVVWATRDPNSAPLQKLQVVKGWIENGESASRTYDVACSDGITADPATGLCRDNGATVDLETCDITPGRGATELATTWTDPDFDPNTPSVYYVRVLENPVCRWSTYDALGSNASVSPYVPPTIKERAWTSPIWYTPSAASR